MKTNHLKATVLTSLALWLAYGFAHAQYTYVTNNSAITITGYTGAGGDITIPSEINNLPVRDIGARAFNWCTTLTSVTIPDSVTNIGREAFSACTSLTNVTLGGGVTSIWPGPFSACSSLAAISVATLNSAYSSVDGVLFNKNQTTLIQFPDGIAATSYTIPNGVTSIGDGAFDRCTGLTSVTIADTVTTIGKYAFSY